MADTSGLAPRDMVIEQVTIDADVISVTYVLRSEQREHLGLGHTVHITAGEIPTEATELIEAAMAVVERHTVLHANPPLHVRRGG